MCGILCVLMDETPILNVKPWVETPQNGLCVRYPDAPIDDHRHTP